MTHSKPVVRKRYYTRLMDLYRYNPVPIGVLNPIIRTAFGSRARRGRAAVAEHPMSRAQVERFFEQHPTFFGFAVPRSGSTFLAHFLNQALPDVIVQHEPNVIDYYEYHIAMRDQRAASEYVSEYRTKEIALRLEPYSCRAYGEINPFLRRHCRAVRELFPDAATFHLVRDGRSALRSLMSRELFGANDPMAKLTLPPRGDPYCDEWEHMSRFEKLCWMWQADNRFIRENTDRSVAFERIVSDYDYFVEHLLAPLGLEVEAHVWKAHTARTTNRTPRYRLPKYEAWPAGLKTRFAEICGAEMEACGYRF